MSEIKGQLLGIILTLVVFGGVAATVASIYADSATKVTNYANNIEGDAADEVEYSISDHTPDPNPILHWGD